MPFIAHFTNLKELNLEDNYLEGLPLDLEVMLPSVENLNLNGNNFEEEKFEEFGCKVPGSKKRALDGLFKLKKESKDDPKKKIIMDKICEDIKLTLNDNKNLPIETIKYAL